MKECITCHELRDPSEFYKHKRYSDGLDARCKLCIQKRNKRYKADLRKEASANGTTCEKQMRARAHKKIDETINIINEHNEALLENIHSVQSKLFFEDNNLVKKRIKTSKPIM